MKTVDALILENKPLTKTIYQMVLQCDTSDITNPGQFINVECKELFLRRPISICDWDDTTVTIVYRVVGKGTDWMSKLKSKESVNILISCGNGYNVDVIEPDLLVGGGVGIPPLYGLAKRLYQKGKPATVCLGFTSALDSFLIEEFNKVAKEVIIASDDGSIGICGNVIDALDQSDINVGSYCTCGPLVMMKALAKKYPSAKGYISLEERMGCGFGGCMGCSIKTKNGFKRVCKEGPIFEKEELLWED